MKLNIQVSEPSAPSRLAGMTLAELMVAIAAGSLALLVATLVFATPTRHLASLANYRALDRGSHRVLDEMTSELRQARGLVSFSPTRIELKAADATSLVYAWNPASGVVTRWKTGDTEPSILLAGCEALEFSMYKGTPVPGALYANTTLVSEGKSIGVSWKCSRKLLGHKLNTPDMQQAVVALRNKAVS